MAKIICPFHDDHTESMEVYPDGWGWCFVCSTRAKIGDPDAKQVKKIPTDIESELARIRDLPTQRFRGLRLHCSDKAAYIIWPNVPFFKRRNFQGQIRYTGPKGIKPPIFIYPGNERIICIEGELNCMSVKSVYDGPETICSPGAASQFPKFIDLYKQYKHATLILDRDAPGVAYGQETKEKLLQAGIRTDLVLVDIDYNDILVTLGSEALVEQFRKDIS